MTIGDRIRARREELHLSQEELAKRLGYKSRSSINKMELNQRNLTQSKIKALADALETTPTYIMGWDEADQEQNAEDELENSMYDAIHDLYGESAMESVSRYFQFHENERKKLDDLLVQYSKLDEIDRAETRGRIAQIIDSLLESDKYSTQEGLSNG